MGRTGDFLLSGHRLHQYQGEAAGGGRLPYAETVSYTHLDVYKRQILIPVNIKQPGMNDNHSPTLVSPNTDCR